MKADNTRFTHNPYKRYTRVLKQQGRVDLDADWNESIEIATHLERTEAQDVVGRCGVPKHINGFKIDPTADGSNLTISRGRMYVDGILCSNEVDPDAPEPDQPIPITGQPDLPDYEPGAGLFSPDLGVYLVYLDVWERHITAIEDPEIREVALGGPDTTTRTQTVCQVKLQKLEVDGPLDQLECVPYSRKPNNTGRLAARKEPGQEPSSPCDVPAKAGYRGLENRLYRVEIHNDGRGDNGPPTFKWSRDNGSVVLPIAEGGISGNEITLKHLGRDDVLTVKVGDWVEVLGDKTELYGEPGTLAQIVPDGIDRANLKITLSKDVSGHAGEGHLKMRRWDHHATNEVALEADGALPIRGEWFELENGVQVHFKMDATYDVGDYWVIPARTHERSVEWPKDGDNAVLKPRLGIHHHYCTLALAHRENGSWIEVRDCRNLYPPLTNIMAEDVGFDNKVCDLPGTETVQDALDVLCATKDLREHNKQLHGYGVVCGLKVSCCKYDRNKVVIGNGYALDCEGNPIRVTEDIEYDVVRRAKGVLMEENDANSEDISGTVCLTIARGTGESADVSVEPYKPQPWLDEILENTLLHDFYDDCIEDLLTLLKDQFAGSLEDTPPVPMSQRRLTAVINLMMQKLNSDSGRYIFLSGKRERNDTCGSESDEGRYEDKLLWCFYNKLKEEIASRTYCAMFDADKEFPKYSLDPGLETIFGPTLKFHHRLCVDPTGKYALTCGMGGKIYVYDLKRGELHQSLTFPAGQNVRVQDIALAPGGRTLYAVAVQDEQDSVFATARRRSSGGYVWESSTSVRCGLRFVRLAVAGRTLYATAKGKGLYRVTGIGSASQFKTQAIEEFNATGLLALTEKADHAIVAAGPEASDAESDPDRFTKMKVIGLKGQTDYERDIEIEGLDFENDILCHGNRVYATGEKDTQSGVKKYLYYFGIGDNQPGSISLCENTPTQLAVAPKPQQEGRDFLLVTVADKYKVMRVALDDEQPTVDKTFRIPVQVFPIGIATVPETRRAYVLNSPVNTLTAIDIREAFAQRNFTIEPPDGLATYRQGVLAAFEDLVSHFSQYLKDCFCDKFLIGCPECSDNDKVYLGCVEIRQGKVYNICNFKKRKYAKSFRTWEYWLSTVPIGPFVKLLFTKFCCSVLGAKR